MASASVVSRVRDVPQYKHMMCAELACGHHLHFQATREAERFFLLKKPASIEAFHRGQASSEYVHCHECTGSIEP